MELVDGHKANCYLYMDPKGFLYRKDGKSRPGGNFQGRTMYFRCSEDNCNVRLLWRKSNPGGDVLQQRRQHNHEISAEELLKNKYRGILRRRASVDLNKSLKEIFCEEKIKAKDEGHNLGQYVGANASLMERARKGRFKQRSNPKHVENDDPDFEIEHRDLLQTHDVVVAIEMIDVDHLQERQPREVIFDFKGMIAPVFVPYNQDMSINLEIIPHYGQYLQENGIKGVLVNSEFGDGMILTTYQRKQITEAWSESNKMLGLNLHIMVQVGGTSFHETLELARHAEEYEANSIVCLPDLYMRPKDSGDLVKFLKFVGAAAPKTPLFYDHNPALTNVKNVSMSKFLTEITGKVQSFRGLKFTSQDLDEGILALKSNESFTVFWGSDCMISSALFSGFTSIISSTLNVLPHLGRGIYEGASDLDFASSKQHQDVLTSVCSILSKFGDFVPALKASMNLYSPINVGKSAKPASNLNQKLIANLDKRIKALDSE